jgi:hypothetical protein
MVLPFHNFPDWDKTAVSRGESLQLGCLFFIQMSLLDGSVNNLLMARLQGRNM